MEWNVYASNCNNNKIEVYNIFEHGGFKKDVDEHLKNDKTKEEFAEHLKRELFYYFGSKCEWEVVITSWITRIDMKELDRLNEEREEHKKRSDRDPYSLYVNPTVAEKIDVRDQVMLNFDKFLDYVWSHKTYKVKDYAKCNMASRCMYSGNNVNCDIEEKALEECPYLQVIGEHTRLIIKSVMNNEE